VTDFMKAVPDQISRFVPAPAFVPLGTDGFGRSDTRQALRRHFEVDAAHVCTAVLWALARLGSIKPETAENAIEELGIDPDAPNPSLL